MSLYQSTREPAIPLSLVITTAGPSGHSDAGPAPRASAVLSPLLSRCFTYPRSISISSLARQCSKNKVPNPVQHEHGSDDDAGELEHGDLVPRLRHAREPPRGALQRGPERREGVRGVLDECVVARIVVDVDGDAAEGRDLGRELVEARVVLSSGRRSAHEVCLGRRGFWAGDWNAWGVSYCSRSQAWEDMVMA